MHHRAVMVMGGSGSGGSVRSGGGGGGHPGHGGGGGVGGEGDDRGVLSFDSLLIILQYLLLVRQPHPLQGCPIL